MIRWPLFDEITRTKGWTTDTERARGLGISPAVLSRLRTGKARPGVTVVDAIISTFGGEMYNVIFERDAEVASEPAEVA